MDKNLRALHQWSQDGILEGLTGHHCRDERGLLQSLVNSGPRGAVEHMIGDVIAAAQQALVGTATRTSGEFEGRVGELDLERGTTLTGAIWRCCWIRWD